MSNIYIDSVEVDVEGGIYKCWTKVIAPGEEDCWLKYADPCDSVVQHGIFEIVDQKTMVLVPLMSVLALQILAAVKEKELMKYEEWSSDFDAGLA